MKLIYNVVFLLCNKVNQLNMCVCVCVCARVLSHSIMSGSLQPHEI